MISERLKQNLKYIAIVIVTILGTITGTNYFASECKPCETVVINKDNEKKGVIIFDNLRISELTPEKLYTVFELKQQIKDQTKFDIVIKSSLIKELVTKLTEDRLNFMQKHSEERNKTHREGKMSFYVDAYYDIQTKLINKYLIENLDSSNVDDNISDLMNENIESLVEIQAKEMNKKNGKKL